MVNRRRIVTAFVALGIKGILCLSCLSIAVYALVTYTATVTMNPTKQLTIGETTASWLVYVNEVNQIRYMPGGLSEPTLNTSDTSTYALKVVTDSNKVSAVKIELSLSS